MEDPAPIVRALHSNLMRSTLHGALESAPVDGRERLLERPEADASAALAHGAFDARVADDDGCRVVAICVSEPGPSGKHLESLPWQTRVIDIVAPFRLIDHESAESL